MNSGKLVENEEETRGPKGYGSIWMRGDLLQKHMTIKTKQTEGLKGSKQTKEGNLNPTNTKSWRPEKKSETSFNGSWNPMRKQKEDSHITYSIITHISIYLRPRMMQN